MTAASPCSKRLAPISRESFKRLAGFIVDELGIKMSEAKIPLLQSRLQRRLRELNLASLDEYQNYLLNSPGGEAERIHFIDAITTNKTDFFREPQHFDHLVRCALPSLDPEARRPDSMRQPWRLKLWCAGCSTGQEPYTIAMVLSEFGEQRPGFDFTILGTDISTRVLEHASAGIYEHELIEPIAEPLRKKYLLRSRDPSRSLVRIAPHVRHHVSFQRLNFMDDDYGIRERFEVIFFRNVMIYFDKPTQEEVIRKLCRHLVPGGYLFVGHSESLAGLDLPVTGVGSAVYRKPV